jgi:hypothetical protein
LKAGAILSDLLEDMRIILKIPVKLGVRMRARATDSRYEQVVSFCKWDNEPSNSTKYSKFTEKLSAYNNLLKL